MHNEIIRNIYIVLVGTTHPGNIGATARAMKTMGMEKLRLVRPKIFPSAEVTARAAGADDVLTSATIHESLQEAIADCSLVFATSARDKRSISWPILRPETAGRKLVDSACQSAKVAVVFGRESSGLSNEELDLCHAVIRIPTSMEYSSLNIASAVQIICYELHKVLLSDAKIIEQTEVGQTLVSAEQLNQLYEHLQTCLTDIGYYDPEKPRLLMRRLKRLFNRAQLDSNEYNIIRGILAAAQNAAGIKNQKEDD